MRVIDTSTLERSGMGSKTLDLWVYNGLDCCLTSEVFGVLNEQMSPQARYIYRRSQALMGPILEMNMRGILVDIPYRDRLIEELSAEVDQLKSRANRIAGEGMGKAFSMTSPAQLKEFLYEYMGLPPVKKRDPKGGSVVTANRDALEQLQVYLYAQPIIKHILAIRDVDKQISTLRTAVDPDNRIRTSFNIGGTNTGRLSSALADFGTGGNLQNIDRRLRQMYVADPGYKFANIDLEQADARNVGIVCWGLFGASKFLDAAEGGDLHTTVSRMCWQELGWPEDPNGWRAIADLPFYREDSYRQTAKKLGHGTNFNGQPATMAKHTKTPQMIIEDFQSRYFAEFPEVKQRIEWTSNQIQTTGKLLNLFGRERHFFKRRGDPKTLNEACAFEPQSMTADEINEAMINIWLWGKVQILAQVHDSMLFQYREEDEEWVIPALKRRMKVELLVRGRKFHVPCEVKIGWNWADASGKNPLGLSKWKGSDSRRRTDGPGSA